MAQRTGFGYDSHAFGADRPLILAGVTLDHPTGLKGHSDGDAVCHAVTDAILGAAALGDIGRHFPDTDARWEGADSIELLKTAAGILESSGFSVVNVDSTVVTQAPRLAPHVDRMRQNLAAALSISVEQVSIKAKTNEGLDAVGEGRGLIVFAVASIDSA